MSFVFLERSTLTSYDSYNRRRRTGGNYWCQLVVELAVAVASVIVAVSVRTKRCVSQKECVRRLVRPLFVAGFCQLVSFGLFVVADDNTAAWLCITARTRHTRASMQRERLSKPLLIPIAVVLDIYVYPTFGKCNKKSLQSRCYQFRSVGVITARRGKRIDGQACGQTNRPKGSPRSETRKLHVQQLHVVKAGSQVTSGLQNLQQRALRLPALCATMIIITL